MWLYDDISNTLKYSKHSSQNCERFEHVANQLSHLQVLAPSRVIRGKFASLQKSDAKKKINVLNIKIVKKKKKKRESYNGINQVKQEAE